MRAELNRDLCTVIVVENLCIRQGAFCLDGVSLEVPAGAYGVLMGRTGTGKTTILEAICGLRPVEAGRIRLPVGDATGLRPAERGIGYVPQDAALFPTMTVEEHLAFPLRIRRWPKDRVRRRVADLAAMLGIGPLLGRRPFGLSGGERQRIALGRAMAFHPAVLCLDEPLSALDHETREQMYDLLAGVRRQSGATVLHVTHSRRDARRLADTLLTLSNGEIVPGLVEGEED